MFEIKTLLKQYEEINAELNKQIREHGEEFVKTLFQEVFDNHEGLNFVMIRGWTPDFNDGEPCTHSEEIWVGSSHYTQYLNRITYDFEECEMYDEFGVEFDEDNNPVKHINSDCKSLNEVHAQLKAYSEIFERVYNTNFELKVSRNESGEVVVDEDWYDCGY